MPKKSKPEAVQTFGECYEVKALGPDEAEIWIYGYIGDDWWEESVAAADFVRAIGKLTAKRIYIRINSHGGALSDAFAIANAIKRHPAETVASVDGIAFSAAGYIFQSADVRQIAQNGMLMIHGPQSGIHGTAEDMREYADVLDKWTEAFAQDYAGASGKSIEDVLALLSDRTDHYYTADEAVAEGWADEIIDSLQIAASARAREIVADGLKHYNSTPGRKPDPKNAGGKTMPKDIEDPKKKGTDPAANKDKPEDPPAADPNPQPPAARSEHEVRAEALKKDRERRTAIEATFKPHREKPGAAALEKELLNDSEKTPEAAGLALLELLGKDVEPVAGSIRVVPGTSGPERFREDATATLLVRAGYANDEQRKIAAQARTLRSFRLVDFARAALDRANVNCSEFDRMEIVGAAFTQSTSDFPILLENVMYKTLQNAYAIAPDTWSRFCAIGSVSDFRPHPRYRVGSLGNLETLTEDNEYRTKSIPDGEKSTISADTVGNIINVSRKMIINDDLGAFTSLAAQLGRSAKRTIEAAVYTLLGENSGLGPTLADGDPLFDANHNNLGTGAAISADSIEADRVVMGSQTDVGGNDFLDLMPAVLLVPLSLEGKAKSINAQEYNDDADKNQRKPNVVRGLFRDVVGTPRLTGTRRYMFADPMSAPVIEVAFLDGEQEPYVEMQPGFSVDGIRYKGRHDFGAAAIDYRGAVTNAGTT